MTNLLDKMIAAIGSNCENDAHCGRAECKYGQSTVCVVEQETAKKCVQIALEYAEEHAPAIAEKYIAAKQERERARLLELRKASEFY